MGKPLRVLLIGDAESDAALLIEELRRGGYEPAFDRVDTPAAMRAAVEGQAWDVVLSSYSMPHFSAPAALALLQEGRHDIPFIIVSGAEGDEAAVAAMNAGAHDYVRHANLARLIPAIEREMRAADVRAARQLTEDALREADARYQALVEQLPAGVHIRALQPGGGTLYVNPQLERMLGFSRAEWMADPDLWQKQLHPDDRERVMPDAARLQEVNAEPFSLEYRMLTRDGQTLWVRDDTVVVRDHAGQPHLLQSIRLDITRRKQTEADLQEANEKLATWVSQLEQHNREITLLNEMGTQLHSCVTVEEAYTVIGDFVPLLFPAEAGALYMLSASRSHAEAVAVWREFAPAEQVFAPDECWALRRGRMHVVEDPRTGQVCPHLGEGQESAYLCIPMVAHGEAVGVLHLQRTRTPAGPREGLTESKQRLAQTVAELVALALANLKLHETLRIESSRDSLTGLFNRRYLEEALERELRRAARKERSLGLILLDIDNFNGVNEAYGHGAGDALLREMSLFLQKHIRGEDIACRYSGEEFAILLPETSLGVAQQRALRIQEEFRQLPLEYRGQSLKGIALFVGAAVFPVHGSTVEELLHSADEAVARTKAEARETAPPAAPGVTEAALPVAEAAAENNGPLAKSSEAPLRVTVGALSLDCQTFELTVGDRTVLPTPVEFEILQFLMSNAGKVFTAEQLLQEVWHYPPGTGSQETVRAHIKNLRGKIEPNPRRPTYLKTIGRFGYTIPLKESALP
jgi:diguanylate cyclase (GGDEF)-like protein/PAS domain S-box-containing protein